MLSFGVTFAQVTLYGNVDQALYTTTMKSGDTTKTKKTSLTPVQMGGGVLGVRGSEDLGEGLKASFVIEMQPAIDSDSAGGMSNRQSFVKLNGGFGALRIGKQYSQAFNNVANVDPGGATGIAGNNVYCVLLGYTACIGGTDDGPLRQSNAIQYDLPELAAGLKAGATIVYGEANTANGAKATGDGYGINLSYASGPIYAGITYDEVKNTGIGLLSAPGQSLKYTAPSTVAVTNTDYDVSAAGKNELTTISASYDLGMAKIFINNSKMKVGSNYIDNTFGAVSVPFGGNASVWASVAQGKVNGVKYTNVKHDGYQLGLNYALSKRTIVYAQTGQMNLKATAKVSVTDSAVGVHHSF